MIKFLDKGVYDVLQKFIELEFLTGVLDGK